MNTYLKYQPAGIQFVTFLGLAAGFIVLTVVISTFFFKDVVFALENSSTAISPELITKFKWTQLVGATLQFVCPALLFGYYSSPRPLPYVGLQPRVSPLLLLLSIVLLVAVQPFVGWLGNLNAHAHFGSLQETLKEKEALYERAMNAFLVMKSPADLLVNLLIMALLPAIGEELFFRGALQSVLLRWNKIPWLSILISSFVFAVLHSTFFKILPIFVLGLMLGTVFYVTRNLWYTIIIHFINNALAVLAVYMASRNDTIKKIADNDMTFPIYLVIISLILGLGIIYAMKKKTEPLAAAFVNEDENDHLP